MFDLMYLGRRQSQCDNASFPFLWHDQRNNQWKIATFGFADSHCLVRSQVVENDPLSPCNVQYQQEPLQQDLDCQRHRDQMKHNDKEPDQARCVQNGTEYRELSCNGLSSLLSVFPVSSSEQLNVSRKEELAVPSALCFLLWRTARKDAAQQVQDGVMQRVNRCAEFHLTCKVCSEQLIEPCTSFVEHLLSHDHLMRLEALIRISGELDHLCILQSLEFPNGERIQLEHVSLTMREVVQV